MLPKSRGNCQIKSTKVFYLLFVCCVCRWKARRSCPRRAARCSWTRSGRATRRARRGTTRRPWLSTRTLCSWTPATTSSTPTAPQRSSRWDSSRRLCRTPSAPGSSTPSGPRYHGQGRHNKHCYEISPSYIYRAPDCGELFGK